MAKGSRHDRAQHGDDARGGDHRRATDQHRVRDGARGRSARPTFNRVTVDSRHIHERHVWCSWRAARRAASRSPPDDRGYAASAEAVRVVCAELARMVARDGEGATKLVTVNIAGAATGGDAELAAFAVANSPLVKTALFGNDANWGRVAMAVGKSGAEGRRPSVSPSGSPDHGLRGGEAVAFDEEAASAALDSRRGHDRGRPGSGEALGDGADVRSLLRVRPHQRGVPKLAAA